jgi:hypothetical protein
MPVVVTRWLVSGNLSYHVLLHCSLTRDRIRGVEGGRSATPRWSSTLGATSSPGACALRVTPLWFRTTPSRSSVAVAMDSRVRRASQQLLHTVPRTSAAWSTCAPAARERTWVREGDFQNHRVRSTAQVVVIARTCVLTRGAVFKTERAARRSHGWIARFGGPRWAPLMDGSRW